MNKRVLEVAILLIVLIAGAVLFRFSNLDILIQKQFYSPEKGWYLDGRLFINLIYKYSNIPALLVSMAALCVFAIGFAKKKYLIYRKLSLYLVLVMLAGPGIIVNSIFKENWGRPRPRHITEFDGKMEHLALWEKGIAGSGKSFPSGHASMGFYFFALYFVFRDRRNALANALLMMTLLYGSLIGAVRVMQGAHFASDVFWAGGFLYLTSLALYYLLKMHRSVYWEKEGEIKYSKPMMVVLLFFVPLLVLFVLLATPYYSNKTVTFDLDSSIHHHFSFLFDVGDIEIVEADSVYIQYEAHGFALPGGKMTLIKDTELNQDRTNYRIWLKKKGVFSELHNNVKLYLPDREDVSYEIEVIKGEYKITND